ncbi:MAG: hypothetical protein ACO1OQ_05665 [Rufibacter sp.]
MVPHPAGRVNWHTLRPLFWGLAVIYASHILWRWLDLPRPGWVQVYLDDLLCLPLVLTLTLFAMRFFFGPRVRFSLYHVLFTVLYFSIAFEYFFPKFLPRYTGDWVDVILYAAGGWIFYRFLNK